MEARSDVPVAMQDFKDRGAWLIAFGILEILLGCLCALFVPWMIWGQSVSAKATGGSPDYRMAVPGVMMYSMLAVAFGWLGIGSIRCRRWARALLLILSWSWLVVGVIAVGTLLLLWPKMSESMPPGAKEIALVVAAVIWSVIFILLPGFLVLFYTGKHVKATVEARDSAACWTDRCPLPVLAVSVWMGFGAVSLLSMPLAYNAVLPFFGQLLTGTPATLAILLLTALWGYLAWGWYRLEPMAWWITVATFPVLTVSTVITFAQIDLMDMYRSMGYPPDQIALIAKYNVLTGKAMAWYAAAFMVPLIAYLVWVKRFFRQTD
jgi:hypothetical protein